MLQGRKTNLSSNKVVNNTICILANLATDGDTKDFYL